jgi:hypothetical protein
MSPYSVWVFDCSSSHEGLASNAPNVNNMNVNPGGKQPLLRDCKGNPNSLDEQLLTQDLARGNLIYK